MVGSVLQPNRTKRNLLSAACAVVLGTLGYFLFGPEGALLGAVAGGLLGWSLGIGVFPQAFWGAAKGIIFVALIGPVADWVISRQPVSEKLILATVCGGLLGAALGIKNARPAKKSAQPSKPSQSPLSQP